MKQTISTGYVARKAFLPFHKREQRFACLVCHRGAGKTVASVNDLLDAALRCTTDSPRFAYVAPLRNQAKAVAWDYLRKAVGPLRDLGVEINESELRVYSPGGWQIQLYGSDNPDALRGLHLNGVVLDEYADMDPRTWSEVVSPALSSKRGFAVFIGTPRGHNDFYNIWKLAQANPEHWFTLELKASQSGIHSEEELDSQKRTKTEEQYLQEYECSFEAAVRGAFYAKQISDAERDGRICGVPYDPACPVWTGWDIGVRDATAIWFAQIVGREIHLIDYYEGSGVDVGHYARELTNRGYFYAGHLLPHDAWGREKSTAKTYAELLEGLGFTPTQVPLHRVEHGIDAARLMLGRCWFDKAKCGSRGLEALKLYRSAYDEKLKVLSKAPVHDWTSHAADAFRYLAMGLNTTPGRGGFNRPLPPPHDPREFV